MIFLKHVQHELDSTDDLQSILAHIRETAAKVPGVRLRDMFILQERDEFILVMECPGEAAYQEWRSLCPPPPGRGIGLSQRYFLRSLQRPRNDGNSG